MRILKHILIVVVSLLVLVGLPLFQTGVLTRLLTGQDPDALTAATVTLEQPSGAYVVLINKENHKDTENLAVWKKFFSGQEIDYIFEDISCVVADSDAAGLELARSFQSRLPENQMLLRTEDTTMMLSKAKYGRFDVMFLSKEIYDAHNTAAIAGGDQVLTIESEGL